MRTCKCPNCNSNLNIDDENKDYAFCQYCGAKLMLDDYRSTQRIIDEAKIKQADNERIIRLRELELEEAKIKQADNEQLIRLKELELEETKIKQADNERISLLREQELEGNRQKHKISLRNILAGVWIVLSVVIIAICMFKWIIRDDFVDGIVMLFYLGGPVIGGGAYLIFKIMPEKEDERELVKNGGIRFPRNLGNLSEQNYAVIQQKLQSAGFYNIVCTNMHDLTLGLLQRPGTVESVTVNGERIVSGGKVYMPDALIVITYHGR